MKTSPFHVGTAVLLVALALTTDPGSAAGRPERGTVDGPEATDLLRTVKGYFMLNAQWTKPDTHALGVFSLPAREERIVRAENDRVYVHSLSGPDQNGRIAFIQGQLDGDVKYRCFSLRTVRLDGKQETEVFTRRGDPMWNMLAESVGPSLALAPVGGQVAFVSKPKAVQFDNPPFHYLEAGPIEVWDVAKKTGRRVGVTAVDSGSDAFAGHLRWFPDGRRLAYVEFLPRDKVDLGDKLGDFAKDFRKWEKVPVIHILDTKTGKKTFLHVGFDPVVSSDGKTVLVEGLERWRLVDVASGESKAAQWPGNVRPIAILESKLVLYWGLPTTGAKRQYTKHGSPLSSPHLMLSLKVAEINSGKFQTLVPNIDPRRAVSFGFAPVSR